MIEEQLARMKFCTACGAETIDACSHCKTTIERDPIDRSRPSYCGGCGKPFPWTEAA